MSKQWRENYKRSANRLQTYESAKPLDDDDIVRKRDEQWLSTSATGLAGRPISPATPTEPQVMVYNSTVNHWAPSGITSMTSQELAYARLTAYTEHVTAPASGTTVALDPSVANVQNLTITDDTSISISPYYGGKAGLSLTLFLNHSGGGHAITWSSGILWPEGTDPTLSTSDGDIDVLTFVSKDGGANWFGVLAGITFS